MPQRSNEPDPGSGDGLQPDALIEMLVKSLSSGLSGEASKPDRKLVQAFLDAVNGSGLEIRQSEPASQSPPAEDVSELARKLSESGPLRVRDLLELWRDVAARKTAAPPDFYLQVGRRVLKAGQPLIAYDILKSGLRNYPEQLELRQQRALALARSGASLRARNLLRGLVDEGHRDEETLSLLARTNKDLWESAEDPTEASQFLNESHQLYLRGYMNAVESNSDDGAFYAGINAATTAFLLGDRQIARRLAGRVADICHRKLAVMTDYWALATLGECELIAGRLDEAEQHYSAAARLAGHNFADIASTKRNAAMLLSAQGEESVELSDWFPVPCIVVFTGHLIDRPDASVRFPESMIDVVKSEIMRALRESGAGFGFSAAACGGDLLFLEALDELGGESHVVLPLPREKFIEASVDVPGSRDWVADFKRLLGRASKVSVVSEFSRQATPQHFEYANHVMTGLSMLQSRALGTQVMPVALWDERPARGPGGTATLVSVWESLGWKPRIINPLTLADKPVVTSQSQKAAGSDSLRFSTSPPTSEIEVRAMLFADVVGYSKLNEEEIPLFVRDFMGTISDCVRESNVSIETFNTWGDAIYFVFRDVADAGVTALRITEQVNSIDWQQRGFQSRMTLRTGLHVGPVYRVVDPVTQTQTHTGAHVSRAARIEPIAPPGEVYASEAFAAVAAADNVSDFVCDYVGVTPMAKGYGEFATYHVRRVV